MPQFSGNTSSAAQSTAYNIPCMLISFSVVNKAVGAAVINVGILYGSTFDIIPFGKSLGAGEAYIYSGEPILIPKNHKISLTSTASVDYVFTIE